MKTLRSLCVFFLILAFGFSGFCDEVVFPKTMSSDLSSALSNYTIGVAFSRDNLVVFPILHTGKVKVENEYLTLNEALEKKLVEVKEIEGGSVPLLNIKSKTNKYIFIYSGTIVTGGKQDRMIRQDVVITPKEKKDLPVFCIEHGRWTKGDYGDKFGVNRYTGSGKLRQEACKEDASQSIIWGIVSKQNKAAGTETGTGNFQALFETENYKKWEKELESIKTEVASLENIAGVIAVIDGEVMGVEIFPSFDYFKKVWEQLYSSYVVDSFVVKEEKEAIEKEKEKEKDKKEEIKEEEVDVKVVVQGYLDQLKALEVKQEDKGKYLHLEYKDEKVTGGTLLEDPGKALIYFKLFPVIQIEQEELDLEQIPQQLQEQIQQNVPPQR